MLHHYREQSRPSNILYDLAYIAPLAGVFRALSVVFQKILLITLLGKLLAGVGYAEEARNVGGAGGAAIPFQLDKPGFVTVAIDDETGRRVRNFISSVWFQAGRQSCAWDGLDDTGNPVPVGKYQWKGIVHDGVSTAFLSAFNNPGTPPWVTADTSAQRGIRVGGSGGWLSDHERPVCAYSDGNHLFFGASIAEAGHSIMEVDADGKKIWGTIWLNLSGANAITGNGDILYVAGEKGWMQDSLAVGRLNIKTHQWIPNPKGGSFKNEDPAFIKLKSIDYAGIRGMAITPEWIVLSLADHDRIACFDLEQGNHVKDVPLTGAGALIKCPDGSLLAISDRKVVKVDLKSGHHQIVIDKSLSNPSGLALDLKGNLLVSDAAPDQQCVKIFSPNGTLLGTIGKLGGHREGVFDPLAMTDPGAIAVDAKNQIWVTEHSFLPKRISVWSMDGRLIRDMVGPSYYGGGGSLDPRNPRRAFYKGMEFFVPDWPERSSLKSILYRPEDHADLPFPAISSVRMDEGVNKNFNLKESVYYDHLPQAATYRGNRLYLMNDEGYGVKSILIGEIIEDHLVPRVIFGSVSVLREAWEKSYPEFIKSLDGTSLAKDAKGVYLWQDLNGDGKADPSEVTVQLDWTFGAMWAARVWPNFTLYAQSGNRLLAIEPDSAQDALRYDLKKSKVISLPERISKNGITALFSDRVGNLYINSGAEAQQGDPSNVFTCLAPDGRVRWTYPNPYPANWHNSPRPRLGDIQHTLNVEGVVSLGKDLGEVLQLNGNKGVRYLFTTDGLFITQLYGDARSVEQTNSLRTVEKGRRMDLVSLGDECFSGWLGETPDHRILQIVGKDSSNVLQVNGLDSLKRLKGGVIELQQTAPSNSLKIADKARPVKAIQMGGIPKGWNITAAHPFPSQDPVASFAIGYQKDALHLWVDVKQSREFVNGGDDPKTLFKTGDAVDFRIAVRPEATFPRSTPVEGDQRYIFTTYHGKPVAVRYRFVVPSVAEADKSKFASPTGVAIVDEVSVQPNIEVAIEKITDGYRLKARIPWQVLGLSKAPTGDLLGDVGIIVSDASGGKSIARYYYFDQKSQVVSDLPSETRVNPENWGIISF